MHAFHGEYTRNSCGSQSGIVYHSDPLWIGVRSKMIRVAIQLTDPTQEMMLRAMLERAGFAVDRDQADVAIHDDFDEAVRLSESMPTLVVTSFANAPRAVEAMTRGVAGYILLPFQPEEAALMVRRAATAGQREKPFEPRPLAEVESDHILAVVRHCNGNRSKAAQLLGIGRNTLWRKLAALEGNTEQ